MPDELGDLLNGLWLGENSAMWQEDEKALTARVPLEWEARSKATELRKRKIRDLFDQAQVEAHERGLAEGQDLVSD